MCLPILAISIFFSSFPHIQFDYALKDSSRMDGVMQTGLSKEELVFDGVVTTAGTRKIVSWYLTWWAPRWLCFCMGSCGLRITKLGWCLLFGISWLGTIGSMRMIRLRCPRPYIRRPWFEGWRTVILLISWWRKWRSAKRGWISLRKKIVNSGGSRDL